MNEQLTNAYSIPILRNFEIDYLFDICKPKIKDFNKKWNDITGYTHGWEKYSMLINKLIQEGFDDSEIEKMLFNGIVFDLPNEIMTFPISGITRSSFVKEQSQKSYFNRKITKLLSKEEKVVSMRMVDDLVVLLFRLETIELGPKRPVKSLFYIPVVIDFTKSIIQIRLRKHYVSSSKNNNHNSIIKFVKEEMKNHISDLSINKYNESQLFSCFYKIFKEEAEKAEKIIQNSPNNKFTPSQIDSKIRNFLLNDLKITEQKSYTERIKSTYYQEIAKHIKIKEFKDGYISSFTFFDKNFTKSSTRHPKREPIYTSPIYWNLRELVNDYEEISLLSVFWKFDKNDFEKKPDNDFEFVEVTFSILEGSLYIYFYKNNMTNRRIKENYVYYRIRKNLFG